MTNSNLLQKAKRMIGSDDSVDIDCTDDVTYHYALNEVDPEIVDHLRRNETLKIALDDEATGVLYITDQYTEDNSEEVILEII